MVALKNHPIWERLGDPALFDDGLGNPYEPFAFGSGMGTVDVSRDDAMGLGIIDRDTQVDKTEDRLIFQPKAQRGKDARETTDFDRLMPH
jgi:hypothetical protein